MPNQEVVLTESEDALISQLVASGKYRDADEVISAGLRLLEGAAPAQVDLRPSLKDGLSQTGRKKTAAGETAIKLWRMAPEIPPASTEKAPRAGPAQDIRD